MGGVQSAVANAPRTAAARPPAPAPQTTRTTGDGLPPLELRQAVDAAVRGVSLRALRAAAERLSAAYRSGGAASVRRAGAGVDVDRLAYVAARMPATYRAASAVLRELRVRRPRLRIASLLDVGSGPATCLWAAWSEFGELARATLIEPDMAMAALGGRLTQGSSLTSRVDVTWRAADAGELATAPAHDLVVAGYLLGELPEERRGRMIDEAWAAARRAVVIIEPGSADGFRRILEARDRLIAAGASIAAPCPHAGCCPMPPGDWCHFAARLNRTALQRRLKGGALAYEDEKHAYVAAVRDAGSPAPARVVRRPRTAPGRVTLRLCRPDGLRDETVTRTRRAEYRAARKAAWGDGWEPAAGADARGG